MILFFIRYIQNNVKKILSKTIISTIINLTDKTVTQ